MTEQFKCAECSATETSAWKGKKSGRILCKACYIKERKRGNAKKKKPKIYSMWGE